MIILSIVIKVKIISLVLFGLVIQLTLTTPQMLPELIGKMRSQNFIR